MFRLTAFRLRWLTTGIPSLRRAWILTAPVESGKAARKTWLGAGQRG